MPDFMRDDICLSKFPWRFEARFQFTKEGEVKIDTFIAGAVKRARIRFSLASRG
jgi:hypothetical protein